MNAIPFLSGPLSLRPRPTAGPCRQRLWMPVGRVRTVHAQDTTLRCISGRVWLTETGGGEDVVLNDGERYVCGRGKVVVEGLIDSMLCLDGQNAE